jgi:hypothetical protein
MSDLGLSTIAQLLFHNEQSIDFARIVAELAGALTRPQSPEVRIAWDCDDFVCFDVPGTRIQLSWAEVERRGYHGCLSVAVGPGEDQGRGHHEDLCSRLVDRICTRFDPISVVWCQAEGVVGAEVIDSLTEALPHLAPPLPDIDSLVAGLTEQDQRLRGQPMVAANSQPDLPRQSDPNLTMLRTALYPDDNGPPYSTQMRLAVHCLNATLIVVWAPMGAALMTYSILKGENMRLSSRMMALAGTVFALAHSPVGSTVAAMARTVG